MQRALHRPTMKRPVSSSVAFERHCILHLVDVRVGSEPLLDLVTQCQCQSLSFFLLAEDRHLIVAFLE